MATLGSLRTYTRMINILRKAFDAPEGDLEFLKDSQKVIDWIESSKYALNSKKAIYIAVVGTLKTLDYDITLYRSQMDKHNKQISDNYNDQVLSVAEAAKYLPWTTILETVEKARASTSDVWTLQEYLILCLYTMLPPVRLDYGDMLVCDSEPPKLEGNYLILSKKPYFLFSDYKTFKTYGVIRTPVPRGLLDVIYKWLPFTDTHLLLDRSGDPLSGIQLGQLLISIFQKHCDKNVGVSILRHSYISFVRGSELPIKKSDALARQMHHSPKMSQQYRKL